MMQKVRARWKIYWNRRGKNAYLYGSELYFHAKDHVEFRNALVSPGTCIMLWTSRTNFQRDHAEPELPIIDGESSYHISVDMETDKADGCLVRMVFRDRYGNDAGNLLVQQKEMDFSCPLKTYAYEIQLISAGASVLHFHSITISEYDPDSQEQTL